MRSGHAMRGALDNGPKAATNAVADDRSTEAFRRDQAESKRLGEGLIT